MERRGMKGLELWCKRVTEGYEGVAVDNMTTSWRDGLAFCALIHHFRPELIDYAKLNKNDVFRNNELAFRVAQQYLGIPALLEPEDMVKYPVPDRLSILTYLSQFYKVFATNQSNNGVSAPVRPNKPSSNVSEMSPTTQTNTPSKNMDDLKKLSVPHREPCFKCSRPVFFAERLVVDDNLYHSACFRCARCGNQLKAGNYYQTEHDEEEYCCETCPDEDVDSLLNNMGFAREEEPDEDSEDLKSACDVVVLDTSSENSNEHDVRSKEGVDLHSEYEDTKQNEGLNERKETAPVQKVVLNDEGCVDVEDSFSKYEDFKEVEDYFSVKDTSEETDVVFKTPVKPEKEFGSSSKVPRNEEFEERDVHDLQDRNPFDSADKERAPDEEDQGGESKLEEPKQEVSQEDKKELSIRKDGILENKIISEGLKNKEGKKEEDGVKNDEDGVKNDEIGETNEEVNHTTEKIAEKEGKIKNDSSSKYRDPLEDLDSITSPETCASASTTILNEERDEKPTPKPRKKILPHPSEYILTTGSVGDTPEYMKRKYERISVGPVMNFKKIVPLPSETSLSSIESPSLPYKHDTLTAPKEEVKAKETNSTNPFDSSDDEDEDFKEVESMTAKNENMRTIKAAINKNPFDTSSEEEDGKEDTLSVTSSQSVNSTARAVTPSSSQFGTYRKKKQAPPPPTALTVLHAESNLRKSPCSSLASSTLSLSDTSSPRRKRSPKRRAPLPPSTSTISTPTESHLMFSKAPSYSLSPITHLRREKNLEEKEKILKDEQNRIKKSLKEDKIPIRRTDKSFQGQWKRKKGQAPAKPVAIKRTIRALPVADLKKELEVIDVQLQGLEKQGVRLEEMIREQCEGPEVNPNNDTSYVPVEVQDLILQLFEVVNEKNELCRRQAELMYLKRQHRLEEEQAEVEYQIRCLMLKTRKTDTDKVREEELITRHLQIVDRRAEIVDCLEMDRVREAEEDLSIADSLTNYATLRDQKHSKDVSNEQRPAKKKDSQQQHGKKRFRKKVMSKLGSLPTTRKFKTPTDLDKDIDESVPSSHKDGNKDRKKNKPFKLF